MESLDQQPATAPAIETPRLPKTPTVPTMAKDDGRVLPRGSILNDECLSRAWKVARPGFGLPSLPAPWPMLLGAADGGFLPSAPKVEHGWSLKDLSTSPPPGSVAVP